MADGAVMTAVRGARAANAEKTAGVPASALASGELRASAAAGAGLRANGVAFGEEEASPAARGVPGIRGGTSDALAASGAKARDQLAGK